MEAAAASAYYDFQGLSALRSEAIRAPNKAIEEVAGQFESLFVQMMLKSMRDATIEGGLFQSNQMETYQGMLDQQLSLHLSREGALGLSDILVEQLEGPNASGEEQASDLPVDDPVMSLLTDARRRYVPAVPSGSGAAPATLAVNRPGPVSADPVDEHSVWNPASPEEYIRDVWDHAVEAAGQLGLDPAVLVAQSALETGWGKKVIKSDDGSSSFNMFGIKAGNSWSGEHTSVQSLEFQDGVAALERSSFRVYDSLETSFRDYASFLKDNPRYQQALEKVGDAREFLNGLQTAGYATDPGYAGKIMDILTTTLASVGVPGVKNFQ